MSDTPSTEQVSWKRIASSPQAFWVVAAIAAAALIVSVLPRTASNSPAVVDLQTRIAQIETRVEVLDNGVNDALDKLAMLDSQKGIQDAHEAIGGGGINTPDYSALISRMEALETKLNNNANNPDLVTREQVVTLQSEVNNLRREVTDVSKHSSHGDRQVKLLVAYYRLRDLILAGDPYRDELAKVDYFAPPDSSVDSAFENIRPYGEDGVPTPDILNEDFDMAAKQAIAGTYAPDGTGSLGERIKGNIAQLITIRKTDGSNSDTSDDAIISRAEGQMEEGNIAEAIKELQALSPKAKPAFDEWLSDANEYLTVQETLQQLDKAILDRVADRDNAAVAGQP